MTTIIHAASPRQGWGRPLNYTLVKIVIAALMVMGAAFITLKLAAAIVSKEGRVIWPELLAALAVLAAYWAYVRLVEKRPLIELSRLNALPELGLGLLIGAVMVALEIGVLRALGAYEMTGTSAWTLALVQPLAVMIFVGVVEEIVGRGIIFRMAEEALGSWAAIAISALIFGLAHLPGEGAGVMAISNTVVAGAFFAAAYMLTRRLWLCIGIHVAWNYTLGSIFSIAVSGNESKGWLVGKLTGPDWLTGGSYGLEASVITLIALLIAGGCMFGLAHARGHFVRARSARQANS